MPAPLIIVSTSLICGRGTINHIDNFTICNSPAAARRLKLGTSHRNASKTKKEEREERERVETVEEAEQQQGKWRTHGRRKHWDIEIHLAKGNPKVPVASAAQQVQWKDMASMCVNMYLYIYLYIYVYMRVCLRVCICNTLEASCWHMEKKQKQRSYRQEYSTPTHPKLQLLAQ